MAVIESMRPAFYSQARRRYFFTKKAAVRAEASAIIRKRYPSEHGDETGGGFHWTQLPRSEVMLRRLARKIEGVTP
jgi:hypothetical protein